ncbi:acyltransferase [Streptococcus suis]|uniref:Sugar O-acetyltransferase n=1 Tax=Streptococcus suis TaxID=1307 RepID=A0A1P8VRD4_STRSU|nr:acyltransferase [Streptococcus suis]APZ79183.1 Sugar O-acetyltransferase [Streptococcus suis]MCK4031913.1 acyltransferase [Streptococcus suis]NQI77204.1 acyltransferase [Streptococcus suis]NQI78988.1 acyltransferase [Streptococcus suis]NQI82453.1 acyltransferase [Streptococcus suis]
MIGRAVVKIESIIHYLFNFSLYFPKRVKIYGKPRVLFGEKIEFSENVRINDKVFLHAVNGIVIGKNSTLSYGATLITESYDVTNREKYMKRLHKGARIEIGDNVWIGANVIILPGVNIADGVIVGAGSVVTKCLTKKNSLYAGNPAKFIKEYQE